MIVKGAIDLINAQKIGGWIYSETNPTRGAEVLAFLDGDCVGSGRVDRYRQDLADAGLGDGFLGFDFPIALKHMTEYERVYIRLSGSDAVLLPPAARIEVANRKSHFMRAESSFASIEFMRKNGWLSSSDVSFLNYVSELGIFELSLVRLKIDQEQGAGRIVDPVILARKNFELLALSEVVVRELELKSPSEDDVLSSLSQISARPHPVIAVLADKPCFVDLIEGSHKDKIKPKSLVGSVHHPLGPDRLIFINVLSAFEFLSSDPDTTYRILTASID